MPRHLNLQTRVFQTGIVSHSKIELVPSRFPWLYNCARYLELWFKGFVDLSPDVPWSNGSNRLIIVQRHLIQVFEPDSNSARTAGSSCKGSMTSTPGSKGTFSKARQQNGDRYIRILSGLEDAMGFDFLLLHRPEGTSESVVCRGVLRQNPVGAKYRSQCRALVAVSILLLYH